MSVSFSVGLAKTSSENQLKPYEIMVQPIFLQNQEHLTKSKAGPFNELSSRSPGPQIWETV